MAKVAFDITIDVPVLRSREGFAFVMLPTEASRELPSRGIVAVTAVFGSQSFTTVAEPDGKGGHWMKLEAGWLSIPPPENLSLRLSPALFEPEPEIPPDFLALLQKHPKAEHNWNQISARARREWVQWMMSAKKEETRLKRMSTGVEMLDSGKKRPCCFDRSGMYSASINCPVPEIYQHQK